MCDGQSMETDKETGRGKRKKKPTRTYMYSSSELETDDEEPQPKETKKSKSKISQCNEMARDLRKQMFGANETKKSNGRTATGSGTSGEIIDLKKQLEKSRRETEDLQVKLTKEKAVREKIQQQLLFLQGVPKFIETFKGFIVDMEEMSRLKADHEEMHCPSSSPARSSTQSSTQSSPSSARPQVMSSQSSQECHHRKSASLCGTKLATKLSWPNVDLNRKRTKPKKTKPKN
ncbi:uncharacterized protein LOC135154551 isoform X2 [Lytechinus pictus]